MDYSVDHSMDAFVPVRDLALLYEDLSATFLALANALEAKGVLTKAEFATAAQERLLAVPETTALAGSSKLLLLRAVATHLETRPPD